MHFNRYIINLNNFYHNFAKKNMKQLIIIITFILNKRVDERRQMYLDEYKLY